MSREQALKSLVERFSTILLGGTFFIAQRHVHVIGPATSWGRNACILLAKWGRLGWCAHKAKASPRGEDQTRAAASPSLPASSPDQAVGFLLVIRLPWKPPLYSYCKKGFFSLFRRGKKTRNRMRLPNLILSVLHTYINNVWNKIRPMLSQSHTTGAIKDFNLNNAMYWLLSWCFIRN